MKRDLRSVLLLTTFLVGIGQLLEAQNTSAISSVQVSTNPGGAQFLVDGVLYTRSQTFLWPAGSKHALQFPLSQAADGTLATYQQSSDGNYRYSQGSWVLNNGTSPTAITDLIVVADPTLSSVVLNTSVTYRLRLQFPGFASLPPLSVAQCTTAVTPQDVTRPGVVLFNNGCYGSDTELWAGAGLKTVLAYPYPGFVFAGWQVNGTAPVSFAGNYTVTGPATLAAVFLPAKRVTFRTAPVGLNLLIDRTPTPTLPTASVPTSLAPCFANLSLPPLPPLNVPSLCVGDFDFLPGSSHTLGAPNTQIDSIGNVWVLDSFSNGLKANEVLVVSKNTSTYDVITANFVPGIGAAFSTNPPGLKVTVDGRSNWINYFFAWGQGTTHTVSASDQTDAGGRRWTFKGWSNGGTAAQTFTVASTINWTANFELQPRITLQSNPPAITVQVDGETCTTPCVLDRPAGTVASVSTPNNIALSDSSRMVFTNWSDGASNNRSITFNNDRVLTLNYLTQFRLAAAGDPSQGVNFTYDPPSPDQFFAQDTGVTVKAQTKGGYRFRRWDGDLSGTYGQGTVMMGAPRNVLAVLDRVPYIAPAGIRNAAGTTPDGTVAPGSLISIGGESLTSSFQQGRTSPLSQGIGDITVTVNDRLLPLVYISPQEIRAQMFSDLTDGDYSLTVHSSTQPDVVGRFTVARNSPGLFPAPTQPDPTADTPTAWAIHADGTAVTIDSPAIHGEIVTVYGTGFGPASGSSFDGFPNASDLKLQDQLQVQAGDSLLDPTWTGLLGGQVGMMVVKFQIADPLPSATSIKVAVIVNGKSSNTVLLPLQ